MDKVANNFLKAKDTYEKEAKIQKIMRERLLKELLEQKKSHYSRIWEFGSGQDELGKIIRKHIGYDKYLSSDINDYGVYYKDKNVNFKTIDMNKISDFSDISKFDLIISNACLQWLDARKILPLLSDHLKENGILAISTFGKENLKQVYDLTGFGLSYLDVDELQSLCKSYKDVKIKSELHELKFNSPIELFRHLKNSGVNSLGNIYLSKSILAKCENEFKNTLTYESIYIIAKK
ncbi:methyltransferase domain-containing protein [Campylobacter pinnipediorum]|uniref:methyltransferase domain-containing protein n=1 Tax=Campylobacter pinnipediorum TaxID=1965231 RepID=UPI0009C1BFC0|nr:methyltransferase domain-containing protein [Campylobacter pinnipediorum]AQW85824.1 malonyl-[acp] methyltransferase [Campylobacter pinnipediorum subsp. caledonicus]